MDPFDAMLRARLARLVAAAPAGQAPPRPLATSRTPEAWRHAGKVASGRIRVDHETRSSRAVLTGLAAAALLVATTTGLIMYLSDPMVPAGQDPVAGAVADPGTPIVWDSGLVRMSFAGLRIETNGQVFTAEGITPESVSSDPGNRRYRTLEVIWLEHDVEMRMNIYFAADDEEWWATEVRVYDGSVPGDWIGWGGSYSISQDDQRPWQSGDHQSQLRAFGVPADAEVLSASADEAGLLSVEYRDRRGSLWAIGCDRRTTPRPANGEGWEWKQAPAELCGPPPVDLGLFRSPRGEAWTGDLDLVDGVGRSSGQGQGQVTGELHIHDMWLSAFG